MAPGHTIFRSAAEGWEIQGVKAPRHFQLYRRREDEVEIARLLHDARDLERQVPEEFRRSN